MGFFAFDPACPITGIKDNWRLLNNHLIIERRVGGENEHAVTMSKLLRGDVDRFILPATNKQAGRKRIGVC